MADDDNDVSKPKAKDDELPYDVAFFAEKHGISEKAAETILKSNRRSKNKCDASAVAYLAATAARRASGGVTVKKMRYRWRVSVEENGKTTLHLLESQAEAEEFAAIQRARLKLKRGEADAQEYSRGMAKGKDPSGQRH